jgi:hypothetical protein
MAGALIVTAEITPEDFSWLEKLRRAHYPPERNQVPAHLTMFRALPASAEPELRRRLARAVTRDPPRAMISAIMDLGGGVAFRVTSPDLEIIREELADELHGLLSAQDAGGWQPHVTIQNKVSPKLARALKQSLELSFRPRPIGISGLGAHRYVGGPWEHLAQYSFRA